MLFAGNIYVAVSEICHHFVSIFVILVLSVKQNSTPPSKTTLENLRDEQTTLSQLP